MGLQMLRVLLVSGLAMGLGSCWYSSQPIIFQAGSVQPFEAGPYIYHPSGDDPEEIELLDIPGGGYIYHSDQEVLSIFAHKAANGWFALQIVGSNLAPLFAVAQVKDARINFFVPTCDDELDAIEGIERDGTDCLVESRSGLIAATSLVAKRVDGGFPVEQVSWAEPMWADQ